MFIQWVLMPYRADLIDLVFSTSEYSDMYMLPVVTNLTILPRSKHAPTRLCLEETGPG